VSHFCGFRPERVDRWTTSRRRGGGSVQTGGVQPDTVVALQRLSVSLGVVHVASTAATRRTSSLCTQELITPAHDAISRQRN